MKISKEDFDYFNKVSMRLHGKPINEILNSLARKARGVPSLHQAPQLITIDNKIRKRTLQRVREFVETWTNLIGVPGAEQILFDTEEYIREIVASEWSKDAAVFFSRETETIVAEHIDYKCLEITKPKEE